MRPLWSFLLFAVAVAPAWADEPAAKSHRYAAQLSRECDELMSAAIKRPYGWGWAEPDETGEPKKGAPRNVPVPVSLEPLETPAAGLVLSYAGQLLNEPRYTQAAANVARGVAAAQRSSGKFPAKAFFGLTSAGSKENSAPLPDRSATRASLALLLSQVEEGKPQEATDRAAARGALWLMRQQVESGAWLVIYPPGAAATDGTRIARLDTPETRDCILTMMLAYEVLGEPIQRRSVEKSLAFLFKARVSPSTNIGGGLWQAAYGGNAVAVDQLAEFPAGVDSLASRYSMQAMLSAWVVSGDDQRLAACGIASKSLADVIKGDGLWRHRFSFKGESLDPPPKPPSAIGEPAAPLPSDPELELTAQTIATARELGREKFRERLAANFTPRQHLAQVICGLSDGPMSLDFPAVMEEAADYLKRHEKDFLLIEGEPPSDLAGKVKRLWALYLRAKVESRLGA